MWAKIPAANLIGYTSSGMYFARAGLRSKLFRQSLMRVPLRCLFLLHGVTGSSGMDEQIQFGARGSLTCKQARVVKTHD